MPKTVTIPLGEGETLVDHQGTVTAIVIREPCFDDYIELGEPYSIGESDGARPQDGDGDGKVRFAVERPDVIKAYIQRCLVRPADPNLLSQSSARVGRKVRQAVLGFFRDGDEESEASTTSPGSSPSTGGPGSIQAPSGG